MPDIASVKHATSVLVAAVVLASCSNAVTTGHTYRHPAARDFAQGVMNSGPLLVDIRGEPYGATVAERESTVLAAVKRGFSWNTASRFTTDPQVSGSQDMRLVLTFNGGGSGRDQCRGHREGGAPRSRGAISLQATLCDETEALSNAYGRIGQTRGPSDPAFAGLVWQVIHEAFPGEERPGNGGAIRIN